MHNLSISFKKLVLLGLISCGLLTSTYAGYLSFGSTTSPETKIKVADKATSEQFKLATGFDRFVYFEKLQLLVKPLQVGGTNSAIETESIGSHTTTKDEVIFLFGEPDQIIQNTLYHYNLNAAGTCKAVIGINKDGLVTFSVIKGC